jgi:sugar O-acyltransferase (sialic acid O-acetyltransferase NeuD family)
MQKVLLLGANNPEAARMIRCVRQQAELDFVGYIDNAPEKKGQKFYGLPVFGGFEVLNQFDPAEYQFVNLITRDCLTRHQTTMIMRKAGFEMANFIHADINTEMVELGKGLYLQAAVLLQANAVLADNVSISSGSIVGHETIIGESGFLAPGVILSGCIRVGKSVFIGAGASVLPRVKIGDWVVIGAGAVVTKDVSAGAVMVGNPAKILEMRDISVY